MKYRKFGKTGIELSALGFGCMRLPLLPETDNEVDAEESIRLIRYGIDKGINYIDTAYPYHGGKSELITGEALKNGYRDKIYLATKLPSWLIKTRADMDKYLDEQLQKLDTDHIDFYLLHSMNAAHWKILRDNDVFDFVEKAKASGRIKYIGFSFHDELPLFKEIIDAYDWDFCQIQYNFMDEYYQAGKEGLEYAASKGIGIVIMEPLRGGSIVRNIPEDINKLWKSSSKINTPADTALKFAWDNPAAGPVLSGMNTQQQLDENLESAENSTPGGLSEEERKILTEIKDTYTQRIVADCTSCRYCMPCASGVDIPANLASLNNISVYANLDPFRFSYVNFFAESKKAHNCTECGLCEEVCPQNIAIIDNLKKVTEIMAQ